MAFKFPFTNYHELNLTWVLDQLKKLFEESAENVSVIENYDGRLTVVETELPAVAENASEAARSAAAAASLAQTAKATADTAQENAIQAQRAAGTAQNTAERAQEAADAATQAAQQAQATAQNFDGRITQAENDASQALEASRSFENRVQSAITTANNAAQTATNAQGIATRADQNAALALDSLNSQRAELERIGAEQAALITNETESGKTEIENLAQSVLDSIPADYTELSELVDKKAPVIINSALGSIASFNDGADNMKIQKLVVNIEPLQAGSGEPSPNNIRPFSGWTEAEISGTGVNVWDEEWEVGDIRYTEGSDLQSRDHFRNKGYIPIVPNTQYYLKSPGLNLYFYDKDKNYLGRNTGGLITGATNRVFTAPNSARFMRFASSLPGNNVYNNDISINYPAIDTDYHPYTGNQISVTFPETIYGGEDEIISGKLKKTMDIVDLGTLNWSYTSSSGRSLFTSYDLQNRYKPSGSDYIPVNAMFECYLNVAINSTFRNGDAGLDGNMSSRIVICDNRYPDAAAFKAAMSGVHLCYELSTPVEYDLTPQTIETLYGTNNIWADTGDVSVDYPADTKLYIDAKLAELQATILENI